MSDFSHQDTADSKCSGVAWILDQHKEKTRRDPTAREKFNTYRLADDKEKVMDLICRVTRVSVEAMKTAKRDCSLYRTAPIGPNRPHYQERAS